MAATLARVTWWAWTLLWVVLVAAAALFLYLSARRVLRLGAALTRELGAASDALAAVGTALEQGPGAGRAGVTEAVPAGRAPSTRGSRRRRRRAAGSQDVR